MEPSCHSVGGEGIREVSNRDGLEGRKRRKRKTRMVVEDRREEDRGAVGRVASPGNWEIRFWANCLASSWSDSFGSRFPGVKPNHLLKRDDGRPVYPLPFSSPLAARRQCGSDGWNEIRLPLLVTGITYRVRSDLWRPRSNKLRIIRLVERIKECVPLVTSTSRIYTHLILSGTIYSLWLIFTYFMRYYIYETVGSLAYFG